MDEATTGGWRGLARRMWARATRLPRGWLILLVGAAASTAVLLVYGGITVYDYTMNNPAFCRSCHTMEAAWNRWTTSEHRNVDCHACHEQSVIESARQVITFALRRPERVGKHAVVLSARCATCHTSGSPAWRQVAATAGHQVHAEARQIACVTCHSVAIHRLVRPPEVCGTCHEAQVAGPRAIKIAAMADFHCVDCHQFLRPNSPLRPTAQTCLECHRALPAKTTVGWPEGRAHSALSCATCHRPHERAAPIVNCTSCHAAPTPEVHAPILRSRTACTTCHQPHYWKVR